MSFGSFRMPGAAGLLLMLGASTMEGQGSIRGLLVDSLRSGGPVEGAQVVLMGAQRRATTEAGGGFTFADLPAGRYVVAYWAPWLDSLGLPAIQREVSVRDGDSERVTLATPSPQTIQLIDAIVPKLLKNVREDESEDVVGSSLETIGIILKTVPPAAAQHRKGKREKERGEVLVFERKRAQYLSEMITFWCRLAGRCCRHHERAQARNQLSGRHSRMCLSICACFLFSDPVLHLGQ